MAPTLYRIILQVDNLGKRACFVDENTLFTGR